MTDPENFLSRWSRKKRGALDEPTTATPAEGVAARVSPGKDSDTPRDTSAALPSEATFDPASLPSLDSIGAQTDIRDFLQPGVPPDLARAALRRAWTADPAIRDFKGLQENDWDFNDPNAMAGFGKLDPDFDINRMLASVFGETPKEAATPPATQEGDRGLSPPHDQETGPEREPQPDSSELMPALSNTSSATSDADTDANIVQSNMNGALQDSDANSATKRDTHVRSHGGALPRWDGE